MVANANTATRRRIVITQSLNTTHSATTAQKKDLANKHHTKRGHKPGAKDSKTGKKEKKKSERDKGVKRLLKG